MKAYYSRNFLVTVKGLIPCAVVLCMLGSQTLQASPVPTDSHSVDRNILPGGNENTGDGVLSTDYMLEQARDAANRFDFIIAEALYQTVLLRERTNLSAILELADVYEKTGKLEYARGLLLRASVLRPHDEKIIAKSKEISDLLSTVLVEEVDTLIARRQCDLALPKLSMLLSIEPENPDLYFKKAVCHLELGKPKTALVYVDDAIRLQKNVEYFNLHADITKRMKQDTIDELIANVHPLLRNDTPSNRERALQLIGEILGIDPEHAWAKQSFVLLSKGETLSSELINTAGTDNGSMGSADGRQESREQSLGDILSSLRDQRTLTLLFASISVFILAIIAFTRFRNKPSILPLSGRFSHFSLKEIIGFLGSTNRTGVLRVESKFTNGELYFRNGEICHCRTGKLTGSEAFSVLINKIRAGSFRFLDCPPKIEQTIDIPRTLLSLEPQLNVSALESQADVPAIGFDGTPPANINEKAPAKSRRPKSRMKELLEKKQ